MLRGTVSLIRPDAVQNWHHESTLEKHAETVNAITKRKSIWGLGGTEKLLQFSQKPE